MPVITTGSLVVKNIRKLTVAPIRLPDVSRLRSNVANAVTPRPDCKVAGAGTTTSGVNRTIVLRNSAFTDEVSVSNNRAHSEAVNPSLFFILPPSCNLPDDREYLF